MQKQPSPIDDPRIYFATERTLLAWIRTGLSMMGFGFVVARFGLFLREFAIQHPASTRPHGFSLWIGTVLVLMGVVVNLVATWHYRETVDRLRTGRNWEPNHTTFGMTAGIGLAVFGLVMAIYLQVLSR